MCTFGEEARHHLREPDAGCADDAWIPQIS
jgi:hypothetical protein